MLSEAKFRELYFRQQECGLDVKAFCSNEGIAPSTFYYWKKKLLQKENAKGFIPLVVKPARTSIPRQNHRTIAETTPDDKPQTGHKDFILEFEYPNGTKLRVNNDLDLPHLRALVYLLD